ncbi:hypothetical protein PV326_012477, partial [Microctonus aethiopoides]
MKFYFIILVLVGIVWAKNNTERIKKIGEKVEDSIVQTNSLACLLHQIIDKYFSGCNVITIYDDTTSMKYPGLFHDLFKRLTTVTFVQKYLYTTNTQSSTKFNDNCHHYMIFLDNIYDLNKIITKETVNKVLIISKSTPWTVKEYLKSFSSRFYTNLLIITHSMNRRTELGSYLLYTHELYTDGSGTSLPIFLTSWIRDRMTQQSIDLFPRKLNKGFKGHRLLISTTHRPPFVVRNPVYAATTDVINGRASMAVGGIYRTTDNNFKLDTTFSHMEDCAAFISLSSSALPKYRAVMGPFKPTVWILICFTYFIAIIPLTINTNYTLWSLIIHPSRFLDMFWYVFSTFTNSFVVKDPLLDTGLAKNSTAILIGIYWVFTIIITSCYTGSIMAFITVPVFPQAFDTAQQLLDEGYEIGTLNHDGWEKWFNWTTMKDPVAVDLLKSLKYIETVKEGLKNATRAYFWPYAFLGSKIVLEYIVQEEFRPSRSTMRSSMHISEECFVNFGVTFLLPKNSIYTEVFNSMISRARESGLSDKIIRDVEWNIQRTANGQMLPVSSEYKKRHIVIEDKKLALDDTQGMFLVLGAGILIAGLVLAIECCVKVYEKKFTGFTIEAGTTVISNATTPQMNHLQVLNPWEFEASSIADRRRY